MKKTGLSILLISVSLISALSQAKIEKYLGQIPPGDTAKQFNAGDYFENENNRKRSFNFAFSPDGKEVFFSYYKGTKEKPEPEYEIKTFKFVNNKWTEPKTASFSGKFWDVDINFSPDGKYVFFASDRPQPKVGNGDIYYSVKMESGWSEPIYAGIEVNSSGTEVYPSISVKNNLFFRSTRQGGYGADDLYRAEWIHGNFINVKNLGANINTQYGESNAVIAPDETYILFCSSRPADGNRQQIYISFQIGDNIWTKAKNLGPQINKGSAGAPTLSTDGKYLFFKKKTGVYWINTSFIDDLK